MFDDLRRSSMEEPDDEDKAKKPKGPGFFGSMSGSERLILSVLTLLVVVVFVFLILLATGRITL
ncbi:MAG: hypothetical protein MUF38_14870 [Anaerolineae bacterium]|nr:hypothetical protein [Anaerolineae bacterium]